jgi:hypothetical protein
MAIEVEKFGITYYPVPKCGSSSLKYLLLARNGDEASLTDPDNDVHGRLPTSYVDPFAPLYDGHKEKLTVVRDPLERLLSAYSSRVVDAGVLARPSAEKEKLEGFGLPLDPDLNTFILNIEKYCACSWEVQFHVASPRHFLGSNLFQFDHVFRFEQMKEAAAFLLSSRTPAVEAPRLQVGSRRIGVSDLSPAALAKGMRFCRYDYGFLVDYYDPRKWGGIPEGEAGDPSTLHVLEDPGAMRGARMIYPRTPRNFLRFMSKQALAWRVQT